MAANDASPLPQYYGQQLPDGTMIESPAGRHHGLGSSDSRQELLRLPIQPHPAHVDSGMDPMSHSSPSKAVGLNHGSSSSKHRIGSYADVNDYNGRQRRMNQDKHASSYIGPYIEDHSDEEYEPQPYRRRPSRAHRPPPSTYNNDPQAMSRYGPVPTRTSYESNNNDRPRYHMHYGSDDEFAPRRRRADPSGGNGREPPELPPAKEVMRLPWAIWMGSDAKNHFVAFVGEFVGTTMFLFFAFSGTQVANLGTSAASGSDTATAEANKFAPNVLLYIALVFSFSLMVNVWVFFRISSGLFNPAVTLAMMLCRALSMTRAVLLMAAQIAGGIFSSFLVSVLFPTKLDVSTTLRAGTSIVQGVFIEAVLTAELVFTIFMLAKEKHKATFIAPVGIGLALFIAELVGVYYTGGSLNPARSFGPCVVTGVFDSEHWVYWVGPGVGSVIAVLFYQFIKILEYEVANPGQDDDDKDQEEKEKEKEQRPHSGV